MSGISTHILDTTSGRPASGVEVQLFLDDTAIGAGTTDQDGRIRALLPPGVDLQPGHYRIRFIIGRYFAESFYPEVTVTFAVRDAGMGYHVPLLISPFGYTTYRGS